MFDPAAHEARKAILQHQVNRKQKAALLETSMTDSPPRIKIGFVNRYDAKDVRAWSGILYFMANALQKHAGQVVYLGPDTSFGTRFIIANSSRLNRVWRWITGRRLIGDHNPLLSRSLGRFFERKLRHQGCDILFAPAASIEIAHLKTTLPIVYFSDLTWAAIVDYYPEYSLLSSLEKREGHRIESAAIAKAAAVVYPSDWAIASARRDYNASPDKTHKAQFGANLREIPDRDEAVDHCFDGTIRLLWVGVDWARKGGEIALACLESLLAMGINASLTICGTIPPKAAVHARMKVIPFLNKNDPEERKRLSRLFLDAHFLLFPTRAEATGIVICEASAHGVPALVSDTGGVCGAIHPGVNGFLMPFHATGKDYAEKILELVDDPARYQLLVGTSRDEYEQHLNWDAWGQSLGQVMAKVLEQPSIASPVQDMQPSR